jgi:hypothetical protein
MGGDAHSPRDSEAVGDALGEGTRTVKPLGQIQGGETGWRIRGQECPEIVGMGDADHVANPAKGAVNDAEAGPSATWDPDFVDFDLVNLEAEAGVSDQFREADQFVEDLGAMGSFGTPSDCGVGPRGSFTTDDPTSHDDWFHNANGVGAEQAFELASKGPEFTGLDFDEGALVIECVDAVAVDANLLPTSTGASHKRLDLAVDCAFHPWTFIPRGIRAGVGAQRPGRGL